MSKGIPGIADIRDDISIAGDDEADSEDEVSCNNRHDDDGIDKILRNMRKEE